MSYRKSFAEERIMWLEKEVDKLRAERDAARSEAADYWAAQWATVLPVVEAAKAWNEGRGGPDEFWAAVDALTVPTEGAQP